MAVRRLCCCGISLHVRCIVIGVFDLVWLGNFLQLDWSHELFIVGMIGVVAAAVLVYGGFTRKRICLWPWVVFNIIFSMILVVIPVLFACLWEVDLDWVDWVLRGEAYTVDEMLFYIGIVPILHVTSHFYLTIVVCNYILILREEESCQKRCNNVQSLTYSPV